MGNQIAEAKRASVISAAEAESLEKYHELVQDLLAVDDFAPEELSRTNNQSVAAANDDTKAAKKKSKKKATKKRAASKKKVASKKQTG